MNRSDGTPGGARDLGDPAMRDAPVELELPEPVLPLAEALRRTTGRAWSAPRRAARPSGRGWISTGPSSPAIRAVPFVRGRGRRQSCHQRPAAVVPARAPNSGASVPARFRHRPIPAVRPGVAAALGLELLQVCLHRHRRGRSQDLGHVVPDQAEQAGARPLARREGGDQPVLALGAVADVLVDLRLRLGDQRPVSGREDAGAEAADPLERLHVIRERAPEGGRRHDRRALAEDQVPAEADVPPVEHHVIARMPGRRNGGEGAHLEAPGGRTAFCPHGLGSNASRPATAAASAAVSSPSRDLAPQERRPQPLALPPSGPRGSGSTPTPSIPPRASPSARTASRCPASSGPGSIT